MIKKIFIFLSVIIISFWAVRPIFVNGFFPVHDDTQPSRIFVMVKALREGQFPVRMVEGLGYGLGYPLFNFYGPLPYYVGALFSLSGMGDINSAKFMYAAGIIIASFTAFILGRRLSGISGGFLFAALFTYSPYHAVNIFVRGAVGEYYAYAFLPLLIYGIIETKESFRKGLLLVSFSVFCIFVSHNISGMIVLYLLFLFFLLSGTYMTYKKKGLGYIRNLIFFLILGVGLSSFFIIPAVLEKKYTNVDSIITGGSVYTDHFVYPDQLISSPWGYAGSAPGRNDGMSFMLGKVHILLFTISAIFLFTKIFSKKGKYGSIELFFMTLIYFILSVFMTTDYSKIFWIITPYLKYAQFPWRFLNFSVLFMCIPVVLALREIKGIYRIIVLTISLYLIFFLNLKFFTPREYQELKDGDYTSSYSLENKISLISDEYLPPNFRKQDLTEINLRKISGNSIRKTYISPPQGLSPVVFDTAYFPGWSAVLNGKKIEYSTAYGLITVPEISGEQTVELVFSDTNTRKISNTISIFSIILLVYVSLYKVKKIKNGRKENTG